MSAYIIKRSRDQSPQRTDDHFFMGGKPILPAGEVSPKCELCGKEETFMFHITFPVKHSWHGRSMTVFQCKDTVHPDYRIPELITDRERKGVDVSSEFCRRQQRNFHFLIFPSEHGELVADYLPRVAFIRWKLQKTRYPRKPGTKIGGEPNWSYADETPASVDGCRPLRFLFQFEEDFKFPRAPNTPPDPFFQMPELKGLPRRDSPDYYLFIGSWLYVFGTVDDQEPLVYCLVQK